MYGSCRCIHVIDYIVHTVYNRRLPRDDICPPTRDRYVLPVSTAVEPVEPTQMTIVNFTNVFN